MTQHNINWKQLAAAFTSVLTLSAALPYSLGELAIIIPPKFKGAIQCRGLLAPICRVADVYRVPFHGAILRLDKK